jgi:hypothetical protein
MAEPSAAPDVASLTPEQVSAEMATSRNNPDLYDHTRPGYAAASQRMNLLDRRLRSEAAPAENPAPMPPLPGAPPTTPDPETPLEAANRRAAEASALDLSQHAGQAVEPAAQDALRLLVLTHDVEPTELPAFLNEAFAAQGRAGLDAEARLTARDAVLAEAFGEHADVWIDRAESVLLALPPHLRAYIHQYGMLRDPWIWRRAAERWKQTH